MCLAVASACGVRGLWAAALVVVLATLAVMAMATTATAEAAVSGGCCCACGRGASVKAASDFLEMSGAARMGPRQMGAAWAAGDFTDMGDAGRSGSRPMGAAKAAGRARKDVRPTSYFVRLGRAHHRAGGSGACLRLSSVLTERVVDRGGE